MRVGMAHKSAQAMMAEQRAQPGGSHGPPSPAAFQGNEQGRGVGQGPFQPQIFFQNFDDLLGQRQDAPFPALAENAQLGVRQLQILQFEGQNFAGTQAVKQHQAHHSEIAKGAKAAPEA